MRIFFIRHGETTGDVEDRYGGAYDDALSLLGEKQAIQLAEELEDSGIETIFCSPLQRARQTARILSVRVGCSVIVMDDLRERDQYGPLTGMIKADARERYQDLAGQVEDRMNVLPGAESYDEAVRRTLAVYSEILGRVDSCAAVVWHGGGMRILFREILKMGELGKIGDCGWIELAYDDSSNKGFILKRSKRIELTC